MNVFIAMPFAKDFDGVYSAIKDACADNGLVPVRIDESHEPGPIVPQIIRELGNSDFVIADISSDNPNVYYEVGLAHCVRKPTILLANEAKINSIPFDVRHHRVIKYSRAHPEGIRDVLRLHLRYLANHLGPHGHPPLFEEFFDELGATHGSADSLLQSHINAVAKEFGLKYPQRIAEHFDPKEGYVITLGDSFGEKVVFSVDVNGIIRRKKRL